MPKLRSLLTLATIALLVTGCGEAKKPVAAKAAPVVKGIFVSTNDCIASQKIPEATCITAIDQALAAHEKGTTYASLQQCHKTEGADRCDKTVTGQYRARMLGFVVTLATPLVVEPLYAAASTKNSVGFRSPTQKLINAQDDMLIISSAALAVAHDNAIIKR